MSKATQLECASALWLIAGCELCNLHIYPLAVAIFAISFWDILGACIYRYYEIKGK